MSDNNSFITMNKQSPPDSYVGRAIFTIRGLISSLFSLVFLAGFVTGIVGVILTLLATATVLVVGLGLVIVGIGLITLFAFSLSVGISPHEYEFNEEAFEE